MILPLQHENRYNNNISRIFKTFFEYSILKSKKRNKINIQIHNLRDYSLNKQRSVDDYQYGGGAGMVMCVQHIDDCIKTLKKKTTYDEIVYLSPDGTTLNQQICNKLSLKKLITLWPLQGY